MIKRSFAAMLILSLAVFPIFADYRITQQTTMESMTFENTVYSKGVRERRESKMKSSGNPEQDAMMASVMPNLIELSQCDLKQNVSLSESKKSYFIDYYDWSGLSPEQQKRRPNLKIVIKGTATVSSTVLDSGKRQTMFGMTAKWLTATQTIVTSADSCEGSSDFKMEREGWFVDLSLRGENCKVPQAQLGGEGCRPKMIVKEARDPGFFLEGTTKMYQNNKLQGTSNIKTTALTTSTLDQALFEVPKDWTEVDSLSELMPGFNNKPIDTSATTVFSDATKAKPVKTVAIDYFSGNSSKLNQEELRGYISQKLSSAGLSGFPINSQAELTTGRFTNVIGVEIKKIKESGASKIGGLFGKVTGNDDAAKLGDSEAEIVITIYGADGKSVVASASATEKVKGKAGDAVKAGVDKILAGLLDKIK